MGSEQQTYYSKKTKSSQKIRLTFSKFNVIVTCVLFIIISIICNIYMRQNLYKVGVNYIYIMQNNRSIFLDIFFNFITLLVDPIIVFVLFSALIVAVKNKIKMIPPLIYFTFNTYLTGIFKGMYKDPRPFWSNNNIKSLALYCPKQYGNPSGHSWISLLLFQLYVYQYFGTGKYGIYLILCFVLTFLVMLSRMYLGAHSLNQVIEGFNMSLIFLVLYRYYICEYLQNILKNFISMKGNIIKRLKKLRNWLILHFILFVIPLIIYAVQPNVILTQEQIFNILNQCKTRSQDILKINKVILLIGTLINLVFGILYGLNRSNQNKKYHFGKWKYIILLNNQNKLRYKKLLIEILLFLGPVIISCIGFLSSNVIITYIIISIGMTLCGYVYIGLTGQILNRQKIIEFF